MTKREVVRLVLDGKRPPYVPWSFGFSRGAFEKLVGHFGSEAAVEKKMHNHVIMFCAGGQPEDVGHDSVRDIFGVVWDKNSTGFIKRYVLPEPTLKGYAFPDPLDDRYFTALPGQLEKHKASLTVWTRGWLYPCPGAYRGRRRAA